MWPSARWSVDDGLIPEIVMHLVVRDLEPEDLSACAWSGRATHLAAIAQALERARCGEVEYPAASTPSGLPVGLGGICCFAEQAYASYRTPESNRRADREEPGIDLSVSMLIQWVYGTVLKRTIAAVPDTAPRRTQYEAAGLYQFLLSGRNVLSGRTEQRACFADRYRGRFPQVPGGRHPSGRRPRDRGTGR